MTGAGAATPAKELVSLADITISTGLLRTAEDVADTLGAMKGVMMKIGQMASYIDDGLSPAVRQTLARLQDSVPPMSPPLRPGAPLSTQAIIDHLAVFYDTIREPGLRTITSDYASSVVRRFFDLRSPVVGYIAVPRPYVILQRINLGLFAVLGELSATADWRAISEEIWPFVRGPAFTPMGEAEARWRVRRQAAAA